MTYPSFKSLERQFLAAFLEHMHETDDDGFIDASDLAQTLGIVASRAMLMRIIESLAERDLLDIFEQTQESEARCCLSLKGIEAAERAVVALGRVAKDISTIPASDRDVSISDNQLAEAESKIEEAIEVVRSSNSLDQAKKQGLIAQLGQAKSFLAIKKFSTSMVKNLILQPLFSAWKLVAEDSGKVILGHIVNYFKHLVGWS
jgi:hypothetical protein